MFKRGRPSPPPRDEGLEEIDALEAAIIPGHQQDSWSAASAEEIERFRPDVERLARAVTDRLRAEYLARSQRS